MLSAQVPNQADNRPTSPLGQGDGSRFDVVIDASDITVGRAAMLLAMTVTREEEMGIRQAIAKQGRLHCTVTEVGGRAAEFTHKIQRSVIGAALNSGIIGKVPSHLHALLHATMEAGHGLLVNAPGSASLSVKVAITRDDAWVAVAVYGMSALHPLTNHERAGLGIMHLSG